ncbi:MAG: flagellar biosynthesis protein FlhB [Christensenella hongkongensis]|uniref:flagellar biosynthesis protein FlhB n=1 Tax=Christensenella hongkongensis TaxID=270498 RepID=UPI002672DA1B|nr:flagellar biosynthesis protein FlhB [Christensenella hongkongensis]MDY3004758.1 flagellar biosynthesis protein FlhB [Christensenella hongkongensis]
MADNNSSGERTESATPKKRQDARERGQVLKSTEIVMTGTLLIMFGALKLLMPVIAQGLINFSGSFFSGQYIQDEVTTESIIPVMQTMIYGFLQIMLPILAVALLAAVVVNVVQTGFLFSTKALEPKMSRLNFFEGIKRVFSTRTLFELIKSILKVVVIGVIIYLQIEGNMPAFATMMSTNIEANILKIADMIISAAFNIMLFLAAIALMDFMFQRWRYEKDLRMSKYEIKMEMKQQEGDPQIKGKIRQKQRQMAMMRMMQDVPDADVVITNPTQYAVALKYDDAKYSAPIILAKGKDNVAAKIKEIAKENSVELVENKPLARSLYATCEVGDMIPVELYQVVAEILAQVYKAKNKNR